VSKIRALRCFQISQLTNSARLLKARHGKSGKVVIIVHQCRASWVGVQSDGDKSGCVVQTAISSQIRFVYLQSSRRWWAVYIDRWHRTQESLCVHPPPANRSADHTRFRVTSHAKNLHLGGSQDFQMELISGVVVQPKN
jgi:hypothetical protein